MRIAFINVFGEPHNAEHEIMTRLQYCFEQQGHEFFTINSYGHVLSGTHQGEHIDNIGVDVVYTYNHTEKLICIPDQFAVLFHWAPSGFFSPSQQKNWVNVINSYDNVVGGYETKDAYYDCIGAGIKNHSLFHIGSSVPLDYVIPPQKTEKRRLFYCGINFEKIVGKMRYGALIHHLDDLGKIDIYDPNEVFGQRGCWDGFKCYYGNIPFDGKSIIKQINQAGISLALNSPIHNSVGSVSNRTYEAAAAGAVIISDDNKYVRKYFGDSVYYVDIQKDEEHISQKVLEIIEEINADPAKAYDMACEAQKRFLKHLNLDDMVKGWLKDTQNQLKLVKDRQLQTELIDIVCFVEKVEDYEAIAKELNKQYYQNFHLIISVDEQVFKQIKDKIKFDYDFVKKDPEFRGRTLMAAREKMRGDYFMFMDGFSAMHAHHLNKMVEKLNDRDNLFAYSGTYIRRKDEKGAIVYYQMLNNTKILKDEFLAFNTINYKDDSKVFLIETLFALNAPLFRKEIWDYTDDIELEQINCAVHYYLALCSLIKAHQEGRFISAVTSGYELKVGEKPEVKIFPERKHFIENGRSDKTFVKDMQNIFFKYDFEVTEGYQILRSADGVDYLTDNEKRILYVDKSIEALFPNDDKIIFALQNKFLYKLIGYLSSKHKRKFPDKRERIAHYIKKHLYIQKFIAICMKCRGYK